MTGRHRAALPRPLDLVYVGGIACAIAWGTALQLLLVPLVLLALVVRTRARVTA